MDRRGRPALAGRCGMAKQTYTTCAACWGDIGAKFTHTVAYGFASSVDLCAACFTLGADSDLTDKQIRELLAERANPSAPTSDVQGRVNKWLKSHNLEGEIHG